MKSSLHFVGWDDHALDEAIRIVDKIHSKEDGISIVVGPQEFALFQLKKKIEKQVLFCTPGTLPAVAMKKDFPMGKEMEFFLWISVVKNNPNLSEVVFGDNAPFESAKQLHTLERQLSAAAIPIESAIDAAKKGGLSSDYYEALGNLFYAYKELAEIKGLIVRSFSDLEKKNNCNKKIILIACLNIPESIKIFLKNTTKSKIHSIIFAPKIHDLSFDEFGCLKDNSFKNDCFFSTNHWIKVEGKMDEIRAIAKRCSKTNSSISILLADKDQLAPLLRELELARLKFSNLIPEKYSNIQTVAFFNAIIKIREKPKFTLLLELFSWTEFYDFLKEEFPNIPKNTVQALDLLVHYAQTQFPISLEDLPKAPKEGDLQALLQAIVTWWKKWPSKEEIFLRTSFEFACKLFPLPLEETREELRKLVEIAIDLQSKSSLSETRQILQYFFSQTELKIKEQPLAMIKIGHLHDAPFMNSEHVIVASANDEVLPSPSLQTPLLEELLVEKLGLKRESLNTTITRYMLKFLVEQSKNFIAFIPTKDRKKNDLLPSRFFVLNADSPAENVIRLLEEIKHTKGKTPAVLKTPITLPGRIPQPSEINITSFKDYISSPYEYYLKWVLNVSKSPWMPQEMDAGKFGSLAHRLLESFAKDKMANSMDAEEIANFFVVSIEKEKKRLFAIFPPAAIIVQCEHLLQRLCGFAKLQAKMAKEGWTICEVEWFPQKAMLFSESGKEVLLKGRIDRIDFNKTTNTWRLIDYKTGNGIQEPTREHKTRSSFKDLQLPLYWHVFSQSITVPAKIETGYLRLGADIAQMDFLPLKFNEEDYINAVECAGKLADEIIAGENFAFGVEKVRRNFVDFMIGRGQKCE